MNSNSQNMDENAGAAALSNGTDNHDHEQMAQGADNHQNQGNRVHF